MAFTTRRTVAFSETDAAGLLHFARYAVWMEDCEHAFLRSLGTSVHAQDAHGQRLFPRVSMTNTYKRPLRFEDTADITVVVRRRGTKSVTYAFSLRRTTDGEEVATGEVTAVCAREADGVVTGIPLPADLAAALDAHLEGPT